MDHLSRPRAWFRLAAVYFVAGVLLGITMGASGNHTLFPVHAHLNLLGWVSMALFGLIGNAYPAMATGRVAALHFWFHNLGLPVLLCALALRLGGRTDVEPIIGLASLVVGGATLLFAWLVFTRTALPSGAIGANAPRRSA
ncbi:MAG: hypothetical protein ACXU8N_06480 [Telluria sp.]